MKVTSALTLTASLFLSTISAHAAPDASQIPPKPTSYVTFFSFMRYAPDGQQLIAGDNLRSLPISMPPSFSSWSCARLGLIIDSEDARQDVLCKLGEFTTGMGVTCSRNEVSEDTESFWLTRGSGENKVSVLFVGHCETIRTVDDGF